MKEILIIEPRAQLGKQMMDVLNRSGHSTGWMRKTPEADVLPAKTGSFLTVMNGSLPEAERDAFLRELEKRGLPVLFVTEQETAGQKLVQAYRGHAESLTFPFGKRAFVAKVREVLRASGKGLRCGSLYLDTETGETRLNGRSVHLTSQESSLLRVLMTAENKPVSRDELLRQAWSCEHYGETRTVDVHVQRLRRKIGNELIETVYRQGYRLRTV